jgi:hypothetical protein
VPSISQKRIAFTVIPCVSTALIFEMLNDPNESLAAKVLYNLCYET